MAERSMVYEKSKKFSLRIVKLYLYLTREKSESVMSLQLLRCGTSIGANLAEALFAASRKDFLNKLTIALKECAETRYWLELLHDSGVITSQQFQSIGNDATELLKMLISITRSVKETGKASSEAPLPTANC